MSLAAQMVNVGKFLLGGTTPATGPMKVQWELTYHCNLKCRHCQIWQIPYGQIRENTLSLPQQKAILDDLAKNGVRHVSFSGGEMFLQKTVYELIAHGKALGMKIGGNSNGFLINPAIARRIVDSGIDMLYFSLDGDNAGTHDHIRGVPGAFERVFAAVKNLRALKPDFPLFFNTTVNNLNVGQLTGVANLAREHGIDGITIEMTNTFEKYSPEKELILSEENLPVLREQIAMLFADYGQLLPHPPGYFAEFETYLKDRNALYKYRCVAGYTSAQIHPNGDLYACPVAFQKLGNLTERSFREVWWGETAESCRRDIKAGNHPICWITCVSPLNQYLSYLPWRPDKLLNGKTLGHILRKI